VEVLASAYGDDALSAEDVAPYLGEAGGVPPYVIFHDATLREMARLRPASMRELLAVKGVGARKADDLGDVFLEAIREV